jgi:single-stranded DNA-binding protein
LTRSLVVVEGDAQMNSYQNSEGKTQTALSIVQRKSQTTPDDPSDREQLWLTFPVSAGSIDVLKRPNPDAAGTQS